jgi:NTE family protein
MASSALPFIFPAVPLRREFFGDGSMRQIAPISPALHLGADRVIVIGVTRQPGDATERIKTSAYPSLAQIAGHALNSIFLDSLEVDIERLRRITGQYGWISRRSAPERRAAARWCAGHFPMRNRCWPRIICWCRVRSASCCVAWRDQTGALR